MPQDAYTLGYLCKEVDGLLKKGKVNRIIQSSPDEVYFTVYTGKNTVKLLVDVNPACPRIGITEKEGDSLLTAPNFCMLLRKHLINATIESVSLVGFDRIVKIVFSSSSEFFDAREKTLYLELMGRYSNMILTEGGKVLGGNRGINMFDNGVRPLIVGKDYVFPPSQDKKIPLDGTLVDDLKEYFSSRKEQVSSRSVDLNDLANYVCSKVSGTAFSTALEIAREYEDSGGRFVAEAFYAFLKNFLYNHEKRPVVVYENGKAKDVCAFPYRSMSGEFEEYENLISAEEKYFDEKKKLKAFSDLYERIKGCVNAGLKKAKKRLGAVQSRIKDASDAEETKRKGELIIANIYLIKRGQTEATVYDYYDGTERTIELDGNLSPSANAEAFFKKYNKKKRALVALESQRETAEREKEYFESVSGELTLAESVDDLKAIREELIAEGLLKDGSKKRSKKDYSGESREYEVNGFTVRVGRNNVENDKVTGSARPKDLWFHAKSLHSSHVIMVTAGRLPTDKDIKTVCEICAYFSGGRNDGKVEVAYTEKKNVKKPPSSPRGFCVYDNYKSLTVAPIRHEELQKA